MTDVTALTYAYDATTLEYTTEVTQIDAAGLGPIGPSGTDPDLDPELTALASLVSAADKGIQFTGVGTAATYDLTTAGKALLDDADATAQRATLGLVIGTNVESHDADLTTIAGLSPTNDDVLQRKAGAWTNRTIAQLLTDLGLGSTYQPLDSDLTAIAALTTTSFGRSLLAAADASALRTLSGSVIGTDVEAHDGDLTTIAGLSPSNDDVLQRKAGAWTNRTVAQLISDLGLGSVYQPLDSDLTAIAALTTTAFGRSVLALADAAALRTLAGTVIGTDVQAFSSVLAALAAQTDLAVTDGGTGASTAANARTNLGVPTARPYVASGCVWTADAVASTLLASMTAGSVFLGTVFLAVSAVNNRAFTANKDTYIDIDTAGAPVYTEVANNAASPALTAGNIRIGIIVTGATTIAATTSINQGSPTLSLPIASSVAYTVTDSIGNLIYPVLGQTMIGYRKIVTNHTNTGTSVNDVTGLTACPFIIPASSFRARFYLPQFTSSALAGTTLSAFIRTLAGSQKGASVMNLPVTSYNLGGFYVEYIDGFPASAGAASGFKASVQQSAAGTLTLAASSTQIAFLAVELA